MRKIKLYIAMSLNGKIASKDGSVDWLEAIPNPDKSDYGYEKFYKSIDTTIQGYTTYKQVIDWGIEFPYADKENYVVTQNTKLEDTKYVRFISVDHIDFIRGLKQKKGKDIWLIGGGKINTMLLNENLIDEIRVFIMPIIISQGIELFELLPEQKNLELLKTTSFRSGAIELIYRVR